MTIGIETSCLSQTVRGIGVYTLTLLEALKDQNIQRFDHSLPFRIPLAQSLLALSRSSCFEKVDLIHFPDPKILYGKRPKVPIVLTIHDVMPILFPHFFPKKSRILMERFLPRYLREADVITVPSHQTKLDLINVFNIPTEKVHVTGLALLPQKRIIQEQKEPFLLYVGSFEPRKNLPGILKAFAKLKQQGFPHKLVLAGKEERSNRLPYELIDKLRLRPHLQILGYISQDQKASLLQKCALLLWPSFYEGFGIPLLEAMASGAPIITTKGSAMKEVVGDAALLIDPNDPDAMAQAAMSILSSPEQTDFLMRRGLERYSNFSLSHFRNRILKIYSSFARTSVSQLI
ncbi:MAG: glycosyltransferase family 1 protein [Simkaniaceae bacterium]|nr:glycosyltransferase family 1 protein [Candidatus Sacchlamyda saccharinae]